MTRVGVYLRISDDADGTSTATDRQKADCIKFAEARGWEVVDTFEDRDLSAYQKGVRRPEFERMLGAVKSKEIDAVLAWKLDRLARRQRDFVRMDEQCEEVGAFVVTVVDGLNTATPAGRVTAEIMTSVARMESENASVRLRRKADESAKAGQPSLGGTRLYGYSKDRQTVIPEEAERIKEAAARIVSGESLGGISRDWAKRGVTTPTGGRWVGTPLKRMLCSAAISGQREHRGVLSPGSWSPILSTADTLRLRAILTDPGRRNGREVPRRYLLTGLVKCGLCGQRMVGSARSGVRRYICRKNLRNPLACAKITRIANKVEQVVIESVLVALDGVDLRSYVEKPNGNTDALVESIRIDEESLAELSRDHYVDKRIGRSEYFSARDALTARLEANRRAVGKANGTTMLNTIVGAGEAVREQWDTATLDWQRAVVGAVVDHVVIDPAKKGSRVFDGSKVRITWRF